MYPSYLIFIPFKKYDIYIYIYDDDARDRQPDCLSRMELSYVSLTLKRLSVKGRRMGHWCGACHKTSDGKVRMARIIIECQSL